MMLKNFNHQKLKKFEKESDVSNTTEQKCNCRNKQNCPLNVRRLEHSLNYEAELSTPVKKFQYIGFQIEN